jgi:hypothetical protein
MQCFSCGFHVMPGVTACVRCGADLTAATRPLAVSPPRAGAMAKRVLPAWWALQRRMAPLLHRLTLGEAAQPVLGGVLDALVRPLAGMLAMPWSIIPGVPLLGGRFRPLGLAVLLGWPVLVAAAILLHGLPVPALALLGGALALHASSTVATTGLAFRSAGMRSAAMACTALVLALALYLPVAWGSMRVLGGSWWLFPAWVPQTTPPLLAGDLVWIDRATRPRAGDIVVTFRPATLRRVRACEGQEVTMREGVLLVDGVPSPWQSATRPLAEGTRFFVPPGSCFVLLPEAHPPGVAPPALPQPANIPYADPELRVQTITARELGQWIVPAGLTEGRIVGRSYPVWRFGRID